MSSPESPGTLPVSITPSPQSTDPSLLMPTLTIPSTPTRDALTPTPQPLATVPGPLAQLVAQGPTDQKVIALTFDAGADRGHAAAILSTLEQMNVPSTFGMTGLWAAENPDLLRRIVADGHQIMNHTNDHQSFTGLSTNSPPLTRAERLDELATADAIFTLLLGHSTKPFFRPPYGDYNTSVLTDAFAAGYFEVVNWTVDSGGWRGWDAARILTHCENSATPGAIYAFHIGSQSQDYAALPALIVYLSGQGYRFTTIAGLLAGH
jgi:peptidoglycan/xylan/chitin deacetylase (PgdA/CDA1 family)